MITNNQIFDNILATGHISEKEISLLKRRSNKEGKDLFNYDILDDQEILIYPEQAKKGLKWLKKFIRKNGTSDVYGYREIEIIKAATPDDFTFRGFYSAGRFGNYHIPIYEVLGMQYVPLETPYIIG